MSDAVFAMPRLQPVAKVLVVDDEPEIRKVHSRFLSNMGMDVLTAENGVLALELARQTVPAAVVTDVDMPVMDGLTLCRCLRAEVATRHVVLVVVTGAGLAQDALACGCDAFLLKPCSGALLAETIQTLLGRR